MKSPINPTKPAKVLKSFQRSHPESKRNQCHKIIRYNGPTTTSHHNCTKNAGGTIMKCIHFRYEWSPGCLLVWCSSSTELQWFLLPCFALALSCPACCTKRTPSRARQSQVQYVALESAASGKVQCQAAICSLRTHTATLYSWRGREASRFSCAA